MSTKTSLEMRPASYVEWSAVIAGTVLACAVSLVLLQFGNALGLAAARLRGDYITPGRVFVVALWLLWVQLMASMSGAYLAGRMRGSWNDTNFESEIRDGAHGLLVWATSSLIAVTAASLTTFMSAFIAQQGGESVDMNASTDLLHKSGLIMGFSLAAASIVSAVAAWWMGVTGGDHRDRGVDISHRASFRKKRK